jgi:hypothetical protein
MLGNIDFDLLAFRAMKKTKRTDFEKLPSMRIFLFHTLKISPNIWFFSGKVVPLKKKK